MQASHIQLIADNPNLSSAALARFLGVSRLAVIRTRKKPAWTHRGYGIPFVSQHRASDGIYLTVRYQGRNFGNGKLGHVLEQVDRLIYSLENGGLPPTLEQSIFNNLEFLQ